MAIRKKITLQEIEEMSNFAGISPWGDLAREVIRLRTGSAPADKPVKDMLDVLIGFQEEYGGENIRVNAVLKSLEIEMSKYLDYLKEYNFRMEHGLSIPLYIEWERKR